MSGAKYQPELTNTKTNENQAVLKASDPEIPERLLSHYNSFPLLKLGVLLL